MFIKQSTAYTFRFGPFLDDTDGKTAEDGLTIEDSHVRVSKAGGNFIDKNEATDAAHDEAGYYIMILNATDTNTVGELLIAAHISGALPVFKTFQVVEEAIYDAIYGGSADLVTKVDAIDTVVDAILVDTATTIPATIATIDTVVDSILVDTGTTLDGKIDTIDGIVDAILVDTGTTIPATIATVDTVVDSILVDTGTTIPATIATVDTVVDAILVDTGTTLPATLDTIDNFLDTEIAAILADTNELQGDWVDGGRLDLLVDSIISKVVVVDGIVDDILVDTGTTIPATIATVDGIVDSILVDTGTTLPATLDTIDNFLDTEVAAILADTNELQADWVDGGRLDLLLDSVISKVDVVDGVVDTILVDTAVIGALGAGLTGIPWNAAWDTEVQSEVADALAVYDPPTKAEVDTAFTEIKGATWATTDTLEAIRDQGDAAWTTGGGGSAPTAAAVADAVWDEATSGHTTSGTFGEQVKTDIDAILVDTGTTIPAAIATVDTVVDSILVDTAVIGALGAGLTAVPWNAAWDAEVQSEVADALTAYDPPTKTEMDAMWTTTQVEAYATDGAAATPSQLLYMILCAVSEFAVSSTTITGKKLDGSTTAMTWTLDDATSPTSRTRAS